MNGPKCSPGTLAAGRWGEPVGPLKNAARPGPLSKGRSGEWAVVFRLRAPLGPAVPAVPAVITTAVSTAGDREGGGPGGGGARL